MKMEAGVQGMDDYLAAHDSGLAVVGGSCPSVGLAGGYTQGDGPGPVATQYAMAAD